MIISIVLLTNTSNIINPQLAESTTNWWAIAGVVVSVSTLGYGIGLYFGWWVLPTFLGGVGATTSITTQNILGKESTDQLMYNNKLKLEIDRENLVSAVKARASEVVETSSYLARERNYKRYGLQQKKIDLLQNELINKVQGYQGEKMLPVTDLKIGNLSLPLRHEPIQMAEGNKGKTVDCIISITENARNINKAGEITQKSANQIIGDSSELFKLYSDQSKARGILVDIHSSVNKSGNKYLNLQAYNEGYHSSLFIDKTALLNESTQFAIVCAETAAPYTDLSLLLLSSI